MQKTILWVIIFWFSHCNSYFLNPAGPTHGLIFTKTEFPGEFNPANDVKYEKKAEGCMHQIFTIFVWGDASAGGTAFGNNIKRIAAIDHKTLSLMGLYSQYCTIVYGE